MSPPQIILYGYPESPFFQKLSLVLLFKRLDYQVCDVPRVPPRTALIDELGIHYRRIPVLAIGNTVYFDTSLSVLALEALFPEHPISGPSWGLQTASTFFWADRTIFGLAAALLPWSKMPKEFVADRSAYRGAQIDVEAMEKNRPGVISTLRSHIHLIESQLQNRSSYLLGTPSPTYLDLSLFFTLNWVSQFGTANSIFAADSIDSTTTFPLTMAWLNTVRTAIGQAKTVHPSKGVPPKISASDSAKLIHHSTPLPPNHIPVDSAEPLLINGYLKIGGDVLVVPNDSGKTGKQKGKLIGLDSERVIIEVTGGKEHGTCRVAAPRLGFTVTPV